MDDILKAIPRERKTLLFSATMTKKVHFAYVLYDQDSSFSWKSFLILTHISIYETPPDRTFSLDFFFF